MRNEDLDLDDLEESSSSDSSSEGEEDPLYGLNGFDSSDEEGSEDYDLDNYAEDDDDDDY